MRDVNDKHYRASSSVLCLSSDAPILCPILGIDIIWLASPSQGRLIIVCVALVDCSQGNLTK